VAQDFVHLLQMSIVDSKGPIQFNLVLI